jgi:putative transposase
MGMWAVRNRPYRVNAMSNFRRYYVPNAIVFITQVVASREPIFRNPAQVEMLRETLYGAKALHPFAMLGYVFLPDHIHLLIRPAVSSSFSEIMHSLKRNFTLNHKRTLGIQGPMRVWQKSFWDHIIRNEDDLQRHLDYIHYNPVRHGLVDRPELWPYSSFLAWKARGAYEEGWGWTTLPNGLQDIEWE